jgi:hypothetical protein
MDLTTAAFAVIVGFSPPARAATQEHFPGWAETVEERTARYGEIAAAAAAVVEKEAPVLGSRRRTLLLLLAVVAHESGFSRDVDLGPCYRGRTKDSPLRKRCDEGKAFCLTQIQGHADGPSLFKDRQACLTAGLTQVRMSLKACAHLPEAERLAGLSGSCDRGRKGARAIWAMYRRASSYADLAAAKAAR